MEASADQGILDVSNRSADTAVTWLKSGLNLYKENFALLVVSTLICLVVTMCSFTLLAGPMFAGLYLVLLRLTRKEDGIAPAISDVFSGFGYFVETFVFWLICLVANLVASWFFGSIPWIGGMLGFAFQLCLNAVAMFGLLLIVDKKQQPVAALTEGFYALKRNPALMILFSLIAGLAGAGGALVVVGIILTAPIYFASVVVAYRSLTGAESAATAEVVDEKPAAEASGS